MSFWLVKTDPETYSFDDFIKDKETNWDGVRNYEARNNLKLMKKGDSVLVYESQSPKCIVGLAVVKKEFFPDSTIDDIRWVSVKLKFKSKFKTPMSLELIKQTPELSNIGLIKKTRLSVMPVSEEEFNFIINYCK